MTNGGSQLGFLMLVEGAGVGGRLIEAVIDGVGVALGGALDTVDGEGADDGIGGAREGVALGRGTLAVFGWPAVLAAIERPIPAARETRPTTATTVHGAVGRRAVASSAVGASGS